MLGMKPLKSRPVEAKPPETGRDFWQYAIRIFSHHFQREPKKITPLQRMRYLLYHLSEEYGWHALPTASIHSTAPVLEFTFREKQEFKKMRKEFRKKVSQIQADLGLPSGNTDYSILASHSARELMRERVSKSFLENTAEKLVAISWKRGMATDETSTMILTHAAEFGDPYLFLQFMLELSKCIPGKEDFERCAVVIGNTLRDSRAKSLPWMQKAYKAIDCICSMAFAHDMRSSHQFEYALLCALKPKEAAKLPPLTGV